MDRYVAIHQEPNGPGDARTTAEQVLADEGLAGKWTGRVILVTGATSGLGMETARVLHKTGARIFITSRQQAKGDEIARIISSEDSSLAPVEAIEMPMDSFESIHKAASVFFAKSPALDILLLNAGVMAAPEATEAKPALLQASKPESHSRVVVLSSGAHKSDGIHPENYNLEGEYNPYMAYAQSKTANIYMANELNRRCGSQGINGLSVHPGVIFETGIARHQGGADTLRENMAKERDDIRKWAKSIPQGAATSVYAAIAKALEGKGGLYLEDCHVPKQEAPGAVTYHQGHAAHAYNQELEGKLWQDSLRMVNISDDKA
ncbi:NAD(P)-binding protein [Aureobasidium pullulans]|uniref:NAD(P)-binding protein n=1 Tax=Aureobasidium pullulans TaxID=5580 RepID=A0A4S8SJM2_AURPU|nr:NAD(P)-binding protein [Aureobasidium pullulans]THW74675.1 NAD(P)-binding protein [Aureobasidium pullulans]THY14746.1 NAD(P)-binding protein [Aureobasidium pullulans]